MSQATIIIPQYNQPELTCACVRSLREHEPVPWPVVIVDDGSAPNARHAVAAAAFAGVRMIEQPHSGISAAWNRGAAAADTPWLVFLNNDVLFDGPCLEPLLEPLHSGAGRMAGVALRRERALPSSVLRSLPTDRFLEGWCFALARSDFEALGGFDPAMRVYWSDTDLQLRLLLAHNERGNRLVRVPGLPLRHLAHRTVHALPRHRRLWHNDRAAFLRKWAAHVRPLTLDP